MRKLFITTIAVVALAATLAACGGSSSSTSAPAAASASTTSSAPNLVQTAVDAGQFTTLVSLVKQAGLANTLSGPGPYTILAPTDAAFAKVPKATLTGAVKGPGQAEGGPAQSRRQGRHHCQQGRHAEIRNNSSGQLAARPRLGHDRLHRRSEGHQG